MQAGIWIVDADGTNLRQVTQRTPGTSWDFGPQWSPDSTRLAFFRLDLATSHEAVFTGDEDEALGQRRRLGHCTRPAMSALAKGLVVSAPCASIAVGASAELHVPHAIALSAPFHGSIPFWTRMLRRG